MSAVTLKEYLNLYRSLGLNVIPIVTKSKDQPKVNWKEFQEKKYEGMIEENDNIAIICGKISNNLVVIDLDSEELIDELFYDKKRLLKKTMVVQTGRGTHIYCRPLGQMPRTLKLHDAKNRGIDIKGEGGYVIAPPSTHPDGSRYQIISETNKIDVVDLDGIMNLLKTKGFKGAHDLDLGRLHHVMHDEIPKGERNDSLFIADRHLMNPNEMGLAPEEAKEKLREINETRVVPPLSNQELDVIHDSASQNIPVLVPQEYDKRKFSREGLKNHLIKKYHCKTLTDTDEILIYLNGVYQSNAEPLLKTEIRSLYVGTPIVEVKEILDLIKSATYVNRNIFSDHKYLNLKNCLIDLHSLESFQHTPHYLTRKQLQANYNEYAQCPRFIKFLTEILNDGDDIKSLIQMMATTLIPYVKTEKAYVLLGDHHNGKYTIIKTMKMIFGHLMGAVSLQDIVNNQFAAAQLDDRMVNGFADLPRFTVKDMGKFKALISQDDMMVHNKFGKMFTTNFQIKMFFSANNLPEITDDNDATYKRFWALNFGPSIPLEKQDHNLLSEFSGELDGILLLLIRNAHQLLKNNLKFTHPQSIRKTKELWLEKADNITTWIEKSIKFGEGYFTRDLGYSDYKKFCLETKNQVATPNRFSNRVNAHPMLHKSNKKIQGKSYVVFYGGTVKADPNQNIL